MRSLPLRQPAEVVAKDKGEVTEFQRNWRVASSSMLTVEAM